MHKSKKQIFKKESPAYEYMFHQNETNDLKNRTSENGMMLIKNCRPHKKDMGSRNKIKINCKNNCEQVLEEFGYIGTNRLSRNLKIEYFGTLSCICHRSAYRTLFFLRENLKNRFLTNNLLKRQGIPAYFYNIWVY